MLEEDKAMKTASSNEYHGVVIQSKALFKNDTAIRIIHGNETYTLRITKGNKLILTK